MANYITYTTNNMFLWYEGNDPDRATDFNGVNLNLPLRQLADNDLILDDKIYKILDGEEKFSKLSTDEIDLKKIIISSENDKTINLNDSDNKNTITLKTYKVNTNNLNVNGVNLNYTTDDMSLEDDDGNLKNLKINTLKTNYIEFNELSSKVSVVQDSNAKADYLDFKAEDDYSKSFIRTGSFYALNSYINFGSKDLQDAIVYDDDNSGDTPNTYLFYADGKVEKSAILAGNVRTTGADVAEFYESDKNYEPGTVLEISKEENIECTIYNGGKVFGVVSETPGHILGENNNFKNPILVALKGRVKVKINGSANKGDYIIADKNGKCIAKNDITTLKDYKKLVGIALTSGTDEVIIKM